MDHELLISGYSNFNISVPKTNPEMLPVMDPLNLRTISPSGAMELTSHDRCLAPASPNLSPVTNVDSNSSRTVKSSSVSDPYPYLFDLYELQEKKQKQEMNSQFDSRNVELSTQSSLSTIQDGYKCSQRPNLHPHQQSQTHLLVFEPLDKPISGRHMSEM